MEKIAYILSIILYYWTLPFLFSHGILKSFLYRYTESSLIELLRSTPLYDCTTVYLIIPYGWTLGLFLIFHIINNKAVNKHTFLMSNSCMHKSPEERSLHQRVNAFVIWIDTYKLPFRGILLFCTSISNAWENACFPRTWQWSYQTCRLFGNLIGKLYYLDKILISNLYLSYFEWHWPHFLCLMAICNFCNLFIHILSSFLLNYQSL